MKTLSVAWLCLVAAASPAFGQASLAGDSAPGVVRFDDYLAAVERHSIDLQAQRENITSAKAGVSIAGVRPDPVFTGGVSSKELNAANKPSASTETTAGIALTFETADKRGARIRAAESNVSLTEANVQAFLRQLFADAAASFVDVCRAQEAAARKKSSLKSFRDLVVANEARVKAGAIGMLELRQTRIEADRFGAEATTAEADAVAAKINLAGPLGKQFEDVFPAGNPNCQLRREGLASGPDDLVRQALEARDDVRVARAALENARNAQSLAQSNRWVDPVVSAGLTNAPRIPPVFDSTGTVTNSPAERSLALGLTVTIPIPFSRLQRGELIQAETVLTQAQLQLRSTLLKAETEVRATHAQYQGAALNVRHYTERILADSEKVLEGVRTSYKKGAASLLELLNAQRTADDIYLGYLQALANLANTTVKLQQSVGMRPSL
jgi:cobalt-zinc-cadmium efflux system outer membrane protein